MSCSLLPSRDGLIVAGARRAAVLQADAARKETKLKAFPAVRKPWQEVRLWNQALFYLGGYRARPVISAAEKTAEKPDFALKHVDLSFGGRTALDSSFFREVDGEGMKGGPPNRNPGSGEPTQPLIGGALYLDGHYRRLADLPSGGNFYSDRPLEFDSGRPLVWTTHVRYPPRGPFPENRYRQRLVLGNFLCFWTGSR